MAKRAIAALFAMALCASASPVVLYVAANGSDLGSGTPDRPFATIEHARDTIRQLKAAQGGTLRQPVTVYLHGGTYLLSQTLQFTALDSGTASCPITYAAFGNEQPILSGGRGIANWRQVTVNGKNLWAADIPDVRAGKWYFHQLFVNGQRRTRARNPNSGFFRITAVPDMNLQNPYQTGQTRFQFAPGEIQPYDNLQDAELVVMSFWVSTRLGIASLDMANNMVTLSQRSSMRLTDGFGAQPALARYYVENAFELLDSPGEWYLNRQTGTLYYMPLPGEDMNTAAVVAPVLTQLLNVQGDLKSGQLAQYLTFHGLTFSHTDWWLPPPPNGGYQSQGAVNIPGALRFYGAPNCALEGCTVSHISNYAIHFEQGCQQDRVVACELSDLGAGGIKIGETTIATDPSQQTHDIQATDNQIHDGGQIFHQALGLWIGQSYNNLVAHNHIHDFYYTGISAGWTWGYGNSQAYGNVFEYNHVHDLGKGWLSDMGLIYTLGIQPGTVIRHNIFHDIQTADYGGLGIYLDEGSSQILAENNLIYNTAIGGIGQNYGRNNVARNNILAFGNLGQIQPVGNMQGAPTGSTFDFEQNIVYWTGSQKFLQTSWPAAQVILNNNLYWQAGVPLAQMRFGTRTWPQWQAMGLDMNSLIADPLFADPNGYDFRLRPESPAYKIGFQPFDLSTVGPRSGILSPSRGRQRP